MKKKNYSGTIVKRAQEKFENEIKRIDLSEKKGDYNLQGYQKVSNALHVQKDGTKCWSF